ncbi:transposase [Candidatus Saccharibacteria bacterium]|nr:transposase [Candidatus Saccharibacteria bacterium]
MNESKPEKQNGKERFIRYSEEYRMNAAKMVLVDGFSIDKTADSLGCARESVRRWVDIYRSRILPKEQPHMTAEEENQLLKKENNRLKMELEFLKKAAAYFAKESK